MSIVGGTARLFIAVGKFDGYDVRKLLRLLKRECGLTDSQIDDVRVLDSFSFATVPFEEAKEAIRRLNSIHKGGRPIAEIAQNGQEGQSRTSGSRRAHPKDQAKKGGREKRRAVAPAQRSRGADKQSRNDEMSDGDRFSRRAGSDRVTRGEQAERKSRTPKRKRERIGKMILRSFSLSRSSKDGAEKEAPIRSCRCLKPGKTKTVNCYSLTI